MFSLYTFASIMKRFLKYFFFFFASLLIGNVLFAYSIEEKIPLHKVDVNQDSTLKINLSEAGLKTHYKHYVSALEKSGDVIEVSENENDTEDYHVSGQSFNAPANYLNFFSRILSGNYDIVEKKGLVSYKFLSYLSTIDSLHIIFCVYRI